mgnify:CR=1 FL=1
MCYNTIVKKIVISKLFLYRYRFIIGFFLLALAYLGLLLWLPLLSPSGLSESEMISVAHSYALEPASILHGDIINLPYRALQKFSIMIFGLNIYSVKLPSVIIGIFLGLYSSYYSIAGSKPMSPSWLQFSPSFLDHFSILPAPARHLSC